MSNLSTTIEQIKSEFRVSPDGRTSVSIRGAARLADVDHSALIQGFQGGEQKPSKLAEFLVQNGFDVVSQKSWSEDGIPDTALALILEYYAYECQPRYRTEQAKLCCRAFCAIGVRAWIQREVGWQPLSATVTEAQVIQIVEERLAALIPAIAEQIIAVSTPAITTSVISQIMTIIPEAVSIAVTDQVVQTVASKLVGTMSEMVMTVMTTFAQQLAPIQEQVSSIYCDLEAKKKKQRHWLLPAGTPREQIPADYMEMADGQWVSPDGFAQMKRQSQRELQWDLRRINKSWDR